MERLAVLPVRAGEISLATQLSHRPVQPSISLPVPLCRIDPDGFVLECNDLAEALFGYSSNELAERSLFELVDQTSQKSIPLDLFKQNLVSTPTTQELVLMKRKDGTVMPLLVILRPIYGILGNIEGYYVSFVDETMSERKIAQAEKERDQLKRKEKLQDEFVAVASHELRTPIQPILGYALLAKKKRISEEEAWDAVLKEARRLQQLANDILDVSRIDSGVLKYNFKPERINSIISYLAQSAKVDLDKNVSILVQFDPLEADVEVEIDRSRITQVLSNLLVNALKFTDTGSITISSKVHSEKNEFEVTVTDSGKGIPKDVLPILFEKFATKGHDDPSLNKGTGLGLYISKAIVQAHCGSIEARNNLEGGATFKIVLPISGQKLHVCKGTAACC